MGAGSNGKALAEAMAAKAEIRRETSHLDLALRTLQRARSASAWITTKNPRRRKR
jgi:hypothetical protein